MTPLPPDIVALCDELHRLRGTAEHDRLHLCDNALGALGYRFEWMPDGWIVHPVSPKQLPTEAWGAWVVAGWFSAHELSSLVRRFPAIGRALADPPCYALAGAAGEGGVDERDDLSELIVSDPEILSGTPIIRGTRIPVYDVAASAEKGLPIERILRAYPELMARDVELARLWAKANPPMERHKKSIGPTDPDTVTAKRVRRRGRAG